MRIISQDGTVDIPYDQTALIRVGKEMKEIYADSIKFEDLRIAKYSTEEKAIKAMEMCRKKYLDYDTFGTNMFPFEYPKVFQFPEDEEVK